MVYGGQTPGLLSVLQDIGATAAISLPIVIGIGGTLADAGIYFFLNPGQQDVKLIKNVWN